MRGRPGRVEGTIRPDVTAADIVVCAALLTQPLPHTPTAATLAVRHLTLFVGGLRPATGLPLAGPPPDDLEDLLGADRQPAEPDLR